MNGLSSGEGLIQYVGEDKEFDPETKEVEIVPREKRLYIVEGEFSRVFVNKGREGNNLSQVIRDAFDSGDLHTLTVEPRHAIGTHVSITGHITPEELELCLTSVDKVNGFGNRFLWFVVKSDKVLPNPHRVPDAVFNVLVPQIEALRLMGGLGDVPVALDAEAEALWERVYVDRLRWDQPGLGLAGTMVSRGATMVLRTALIYACLDVPTKKTAMGVHATTRTPVITLPHLKAALAVWDYCEESAFQLFGSKTDSRCGEKVMKLLRENGPMTTTELNRHLSPGQKKAATSTLETLEKEGLIRSEKQKHSGAGRPTIVWILEERE